MVTKRRRGRHPASLLDIRKAPEEFRAAARLISLADKDHRRRIHAAQREWIGETWKKELEISAMMAGPRAKRLIMAGARVRAGNPPRLIAGNSKRPFSKRPSGGALTPIEGWRLAEWGADKPKETTYMRRSKNGGEHEVTRNTLAGWTPAKRGHVIIPTVVELGPRILSYFVQTVVRAYYDALDRKG